MTTKPGDDWHVLPHGPLERLAENLWWVQGSLRGMSLKRVMTVARRTDGELVIHSAIAMTEDAMRELEALGEPAFLVVPNRGHRLDAPAYKRRYPSLRARDAARREAAGRRDDRAVRGWDDARLQRRGLQHGQEA
jgi:hypothetical protein